jgi:hypothetical protein
MTLLRDAQNNLLLWCLLLAIAQVSIGQTLKREWLNDTDLQAVCNDGSPAAMYVQYLGRDTPWLLYLQGGR